MNDVDAILFDAGGILVLPDPTVLAPLLAQASAAVFEEGSVTSLFKS